MALVGMNVRTPWGRRLPVSSNVIGKTYAEFVTHITTLATAGSLPVSYLGLPVGAYRTTMSVAFSDAMAGSPWNGTFAADGVTYSAIGSIVRHCLPSQAEFNAQVAAGRQVFFRVEDQGATNSLTGVARNGYTSDDYTGPPDISTSAVTELLYWDGTQAQRMTPNAGGGPTPYTW